MSASPDFPGIDFRVGRSDALQADELRAVHDLFERSYQRADHAYLDRSLSRLRYIARAQERGALVGFALADTRMAALPRFEEPQLLLLGGIGCIDPDHRRRGLFSHISRLAARADGPLTERAKRFLACGRIAHPASFRAMMQFPSVIPRKGKRISRWHLQIAAAVASLYGVRLKGDSLIVEGSGAPIGYPRIEIDVAAEEWLPFREVDRERGDSLLTCAWIPDAPCGW